MEMTQTVLRDLAEYRTPKLNDKLYLHYKGFQSIQSLEKYTGLKTIHLQGNGITKIANLHHCTKLTTLFLSENLIERIENLNFSRELECLDLSKNCITNIENLAPELSKLKTLKLSENQLSDVNSLEHLSELTGLEVLDISNNKIDCSSTPGSTTYYDLLKILQRCSNLKVLYLKGNPCVTQIPHYRKTVISCCKKLQYLDDRPVTTEERRCSDSNQTEKEEIKAMQIEEAEFEQRNLEQMTDLLGLDDEDDIDSSISVNSEDDDDDNHDIVVGGNNSDCNGGDARENACSSAGKKNSDDKDQNKFGCHAIAPWRP